MSTQLPPPPPPSSDQDSAIKGLGRALARTGVLVVKPVEVVASALNPIANIKKIGETTEELRDINAARKMTKPLRKQLKQQQRAVIRKMGHDYRMQEAEKERAAKVEEENAKRWEEELPGFVGVPTDI